MLMASTTSTAVQIFVRFAITSLVDQRNDRLQLGALQRVGKSIGYKHNSLLALISTIPQLKLRTRIRLRRIFFRKGSKNRSHKLEKINGSGYGNEINRKKQQLASYYPQMPVYSVALNQTMSTLNMDRPPPILSIDQMRVARTNMDVTLDVGIGDRIALTGQSGIGKSQVLRTLAGLELVDRNAIHLFHVSAAKMSMADWRSHVVLVPQQRPSLEGTPNDFYNQVLQFSSQRKKNQEQNVTFISPSEYGKKWGVAATLFDRPWSKLSGGESQRIVLAIALSMQPDVLLLDESTSALDESTEILVEDTIKDLRIPVIMVSHSGTQVDRFCNQRLSLERTASIGTFPTRVSLV
jgi:ABC-type dipeptide/oligopeptide/nickel transport system ATPase subunit